MRSSLRWGYKRSSLELASSISVISAALSGACSPGEPAPDPGPSVGGPVITLVDSTILQESDTAFLGRAPWTFTVDSAGRAMVTDQATDRLLIFATDGRLHRAMGRHGGGPGEFDPIGPLTIPHDGLLLQAARGNSLTVLDAESGVELNRLSHPGYLSSWTASPRRLILGLYSRAESSAVVVASWDSIARAASGARLRPAFGALPRLYATYPGLQIFNDVVVGYRADTLLLGFGAADYLVRIPLIGGAPDTIQVPRRLRRPINATVLAKFKSRSLSFHERLTSVPNLSGIWPRSDGHVVLWFQEAATEDPRRANAEITGHAQIAVLSPDLHEACVDARLEAPGTHRTRLAFARDTIYSLDQVVEAPRERESRVRTVLRRYVLDLGGCVWLPTGNRPAY